ncbi:MAG TPA: molybdopterin-synthase adenylyltransferase MoeB, partial [Longimicrobiales bacterium]|nr:molybdopterin-synthase adenylyltransferase MoeB [Longimicrobiales bacterium]
MRVTVRIPTPLRSYASGESRVAVEAETVGQALAGLVERHPGLKPHLYDGEGALRNFVNAYLNEDDVRELGGAETPVSEGDTVVLVPSIAGGADGATVEEAREADAPDAGAPGPLPDLSREEIQRYSRHLIMPEVGMEGQKKLKAARVLLVGAGGLGSPLGLYLAAAGVGTIGIVDHDVVDATNLQRQVLHGTKDVGRPKLESARERLADVNPHVEIRTHETRLTSENALEILEPYDVVVDGTDNFPTRYLVNDACVILGKPNVYGSIFRFEGQVSVFGARTAEGERGPCYRCLFREPPPPGLVPSCAEGGVLGVLPGIIGSLQALETIKLILGRGEPLVGRLLIFDALEMSWRRVNLRRNPDCPVCGDEPTQTGLIDYEAFCGMPADEDAAAAAAAGEVPEISATELARRLEAGEEITIVDVREPHEWEIVNLAEHGARLIPLGELGDRLDEIDRTEEIVLHCRSG